jgi:hypothetical protein
MRLILLFAFLLSSTLIPAQPYANSSCASATQVFSGQVYNYPAWAGPNIAETGPAYYCLTTQYNPAWFYFQVENPGDIEITMTSVCSNPPPACLDIDFIIWGPFDSLAQACNGGLTVAKVVDCTYTLPCTEGATLPAGQSGAYYVMMITNYTQLGGTITFSQTGGSGTMTCSPGISLAGSLNYGNTAATPLDSCTVELYTPTNTLFDTAHSNSGGQYAIKCLDYETYTINVNCTKQWGGGNAVDAMMILKYSVGLIPLTEIQRKAGDVNLSGHLNATDALMIMKRFTGQISSFPAGDWFFSHPASLTFTNLLNTLNIPGLCYGDVNASYAIP